MVIPIIYYLIFATSGAIVCTLENTVRHSVGLSFIHVQILIMQYIGVTKPLWVYLVFVETKEVCGIKDSALANMEL